MVNVLVTGCAGFIGTHLCLELIKREGFHVVAVDNMNSYYDPNLKKARLRYIETSLSSQSSSKSATVFKFLLGDIADSDFVASIYDGRKFDIVINLAAQAGVRYSLINPRSYINANIIGFYNILQASKEAEVSHFIYASSSSVYGECDIFPYAESLPTDSPVSLYAATKKSNELMARVYSKLYGMRTTGLRFFTVYGPFGRPDMAYFSFAEKMRKGEPVYLYNDGDMWRDFTYIDDIVSAICNIVEKSQCVDYPDSSRVYNIGNSDPVSLGVFVDILESSLSQAGVISKPALRRYLPMQPGDVYRTYADVSALERDFGYRPTTSLDKGLNRFAHWYAKYLDGDFS